MSTEAVHPVGQTAGDEAVLRHNRFFGLSQEISDGTEAVAILAFLLRG